MDRRGDGALGARGRPPRVLHGRRRPRCRAAASASPRSAASTAPWCHRRIFGPAASRPICGFRAGGEARLHIELAPEAETPVLGEPPRADRKGASAGDPAVERGRKGDPALALRPTSVDAAGQARVAAAPLARLLFTAERGLPPTPLVAAPGPDPEAEPAFEPWSSERPDADGDRELRPVPGRRGARLDGRRPLVPRQRRDPDRRRARWRSPRRRRPPPTRPRSRSPPRRSRCPGRSPASTAPAGARRSPADPADKPRYADLVVPENLDREQRCLAEAVYFEARSEPEEGQAAVAQVVLNRARSGLYPSSVCGVVYQNRHRHLACQFTFACEGKSLRITDGPSWRDATRVAERGAGGPDLPRGRRRRDPLPRGLRQAVLVAAAEEDGRDRPAHLLQAEARADVRRPQDGAPPMRAGDPSHDGMCVGAARALG